MGTAEINSPDIWKDFFPKPQPQDNKYTRGHLLINGGAIDFTGATKLAAFAAARIGAGMVTVACDESSLSIYATSFQSILAKPIKQPREFYRYIESRKVNTVLIGPGNGMNRDTTEKVLECLAIKDLKLVLDADAISAFEDNKEALIDKLHINCILTPHEGEFKRVFELGADRIESTKAAAKLSGAIIILKGHDTIIASPDGRTVINQKAPVTLATAGTGDVLAGIIASLSAQGMPAFEAACTGTWFHSEAARLIGPGMIADDLPETLPLILRTL